VKEDPAKRLWRPLKAWKAHEWVPMKEAWLRVYASLSKNMFLTRRDLKADLLARRLVGAVRRIAKDDTETRIILEPAYSQRLDFPYAWLVEGWEADAQEGEEWHFFVRRAELDKHYPIAATPTATTTVDPRSDDMRPPPDATPKSPSSEIDRILEAPPRRPVGRLPKHDWQAINVEIVRRCHDPKTGFVKIPKSERKLALNMLTWCQDKYKKEPAESEMRQAVQTICATLRTFEKQ
jgi:hypothetical protein